MDKMFKENYDIIGGSLSSINMAQFDKLKYEMLKTLKNKGRIITSGLGKNVPVCEKFTGSMLSMGMDAGFLHTNTAVHGDLGLVREGDLVVILTKSGSTTESVFLAKTLMMRKNVNVWLLSFKEQSVLTEMLGLDKCLIADLEHEGDLWNIVPNNSTIVNLIILQTLAIELSKEMKLDIDKDFKPNHPGGAIGAFLADEK